MSFATVAYSELVENYYIGYVLFQNEKIMKPPFVRSTFLLAVLVLNVVCLFGQNYKTVHFDREVYFESEEFGMASDGWSPCHPCRFGIRVQEVLGDSTQYVFPVYWNTAPGVGEPRFSWMGDTLQFLSDGTELFRNKNYNYHQGLTFY